MNILYVGFFSLPDKNAAATRVLNDGKLLSLAGHKVSFIDEQETNDDVLDTHRIVEGFETWSLKRHTNLKSYVSKMISIKEIIKVINQNSAFDLLIAYNFPSIALIKLKSFCKKKGIKIVSDVTEWYSGNDYRFPMNLLCRFDSFLRMRIINKKLDGLIVISSFLASYYKKHNTLFVPPLVDINSPKYSKMRENKFDFDSNYLNLIYAGTPGKSKESLPELIESVSCANNKVVLRILGITKEDYLKAEKEINLDDSKIIFYGRVDHQTSVDMVSLSDYMVYLRKKNRVTSAGFSTKFVEAISLGTKVITTNTGDVKRYIDEYDCGLIVDNCDDLTRLFSDSNLKKNAKTFKKDATRIFHYANYLDSIKEWLDLLFKDSK